ncbi:2OG-Fe(II) oxygenase [Thalassotalea marina]|uniref:Prolyl 4-hydroxylase subunit alpha n=1 Tax=Thalassotalea marina TaxID=1673741 RepID=A0A919BGZ2_9GAMM|nr:2OG-Fe(II) oxygenase [Thalassotalea marina]GHF89615.1 prolyl 4-hydroxylase subunit alpha [Thalassotalea marina]
MSIAEKLVPEQSYTNVTYRKIADDLRQQGYSINQHSIPFDLAQSLALYAQQMSNKQFHKAGIGRESNFTQNKAVRGDEICWISGESFVGQQWLDWCGNLQRYLNQQLFLGLFSFESHFAHYPPGAFYHKHLDAFKGEKNRVLSLVLYLNEDWLASDGGELVLYPEESSDNTNATSVLPMLGTSVIFLSEEFPHEVLPATRDRFSIAGWFRINTSHENCVDPPR